jgi:hypothetical protein
LLTLFFKILTAVVAVVVFTRYRLLCDLQFDIVL